MSEEQKGIGTPSVVSTSKSKINFQKAAKFIISVALISILINLPALWILKKNQIKIGVVDVQSLLVEHEKKITQELYIKSGTGEFTGDTTVVNKIVESQTKQFVERMEKEIRSINDTCECVILNKATLLTNKGKVFDYTPQVREAINK